MFTTKRVALLFAVVLIIGSFGSAWAWQRLRVTERVQGYIAARSARTAIDNYLASTSIRKLQIGAGTNNLPGWLNTDIEPIQGQAFLDASKSFPIPDGALNYIYAEQIIEHLSFKDGGVMLRESYRTLAPGGKLRLATPDLGRLIALFDDDRTEQEDRFVEAQLKMVRLTIAQPERPLFILNTYFHAWGHEFIYDQRTLRSALESAGFRSIRFVNHGESDDADLRNIEHHIDIIGGDIDTYVTMIVQAEK